MDEKNERGNNDRESEASSRPFALSSSRFSLIVLNSLPTMPSSFLLHFIAPNPHSPLFH